MQLNENDDYYTQAAYRAANEIRHSEMEESIVLLLSSLDYTSLSDKAKGHFDDLVRGIDGTAL